MPASAHREHGLDWLATRRAHAFERGEAHALNRTISADAYLFLYKELVRLCKERTYCWAGLQWLAERLQTSLGTVKRWIEELVAAGLIRRTTRPGGQTALTTVLALAAFDHALAAPPQSLGQSHPQRTLQPDTEAAPADSGATPPLFFVPEERISSESRVGSELIRPTVKKPNPNLGSGGSDLQTNPADAPATPTARCLVQAGVLDIMSNELKDEPLREIDAIVRYVAQQPHCYNPPGLIVALARAKFGAALLHSPRPDQAAGPRRRGSAGGAASGGAMGHPDARRAPAPNPTDPRWDQVLAALKLQVSVSEFTTWLTATWLVEVADGVATIATPNIFARETLEGRFLPLITGALQTVLGSAVQPQIVIG
jgi:hypothetical protein